MATYLSVHITTCMTRQDVDKLVKRFMRDSTDEIRSVRILCDTIAGRMICEWEAPDQDALIQWLGQRNVRLRGNDEWLIRVQMEGVNGALKML